MVVSGAPGAPHTAAASPAAPPPSTNGHQNGGHAPVAHTASVTAAPGKVLATPATRRLARDLGVDLATVTGTGDNGRITPGDVSGASESSPASGAAPSESPPSTE